MHPDPFTLAELHAMAVAHERSEWDRAASIAGMVYNASPNCKRPITDFSTLNPYRKRQPRQKLSLKDLRKMTER